MSQLPPDTGAARYATECHPQCLSRRCRARRRRFLPTRCRHRSRRPVACRRADRPRGDDCSMNSITKVNCIMIRKLAQATLAARPRHRIGRLLEHRARRRGQDTKEQHHGRQGRTRDHGRQVGDHRGQDDRLRRHRRRHVSPTRRSSSSAARCRPKRRRPRPTRSRTRTPRATRSTTSSRSFRRTRSRP